MREWWECQFNHVQPHSTHHSLLDIVGIFWWFLYRIFGVSCPSIEAPAVFYHCYHLSTTDSFKSPSSFFPLWVFLISPRHMRHTHIRLQSYFEIFPARIELGWPDLCTRKKNIRNIWNAGFFRRASDVQVVHKKSALRLRPAAGTACPADLQRRSADCSRVLAGLSFAAPNLTN